MLFSCYKWLSEAFEDVRIWNFDVKPTDGATIFACLGKGVKSQINWWAKLREKGEKLKVQSANHYTVLGSALMRSEFWI